MITLPLAKISEARDAEPSETKFSWTHQTQDLVVVFDNYGHGSSAQLLKVVQGTHVRHLIEIERLVNQGNDLERTLREHGAEVKRDKLPISALVRCPLLALSWHLPDKKIRRLQLKFKHDSDYDTAYKHLLQLGLHMDTTNAGQSRSSSNKKSSAASTPSKPPHGPVEQTAVLSCPPSRLTDISNRPYTALTAPTSIESHLQEAAHNRPSSAYTGHAGNALNTSMSFSGPLQPPEYFARPASLTSSALDQSSAMYSSRDRPSTGADAEHNTSNDRPGTGMLFGRPDPAEAVLPPRRELPFPRSAGSDGSHPSSRPSTMMGPPPLPARVTSLRPASARAATQEIELPPLPRPTIVDSIQQQPSWMERPPRTPNQDHNTPPSAQPVPIYEDQQNRVSSSSSNFSPLSYKRASSSSIMPSTRPLSSLGSVAQNRRRTESQSPLSTPPASDTRHPVDTEVQKIGMHETESDDSLAAYAMQSEESRRAALNEFIFRNLEDDNFVTLLEDMETCWARSGLGMR
ncbi:hypothetical protein HBI56_214560 [Parastagonospora nodorum]|uniref:Uncharacterized protein n=1 Tax=Phaeosphaeria nodorum (strain SN15 / ATCC MYA-4574 / FGSC 10173) TaxID=321614 RepID=A0A7U2I2J4_PHANO|nr:hypothetical protein HBH56_230520 [Parastagonospora nodorum]QRC99418.1 hypothetical protein JI435_143370 [Parastagonospora nodorum SN15]KAH3924500.1 hypothetical protein HBH54_194650 [Parastagonospora nodorum]KAH3940179.1 hypothetical protein HBH53_222240 [Parastagonospora nodorum]KAH3958342.1 hypothetical protein HBH51_210240 [Parastagonospora nodorum]